MNEIYLDNSATTRPLPAVIEQMTAVLTENYGNPSSLHNKGLAAERVMKLARKILADRLRVTPAEIIFTSGGTESNNLAIKGTAYQYQARGRHLITSKVEHASVIDTFSRLEEEGFEVTYLATDQFGLISLTELQQAIRSDTILVSLIHVNNELGSINPIDEIGPLIKKTNRTTLFHVDAVQSFGKIFLDPAFWEIDLLTISAHKIHGPKGIGALYLKKGRQLKPLLNGGGQENGLRSGTENIPGIAGFIPAVDNLPDLSTSNPIDQELNQLKEHFLSILKDLDLNIRINTPENGAPHIISLSFPGAKAEILVHSLESEGIYVSTGSACHSRQQLKKHVLEAIKLPSKLIEGTIRISLSHSNTRTELEYTIKKIQEQFALFF